MKGERAIAVRVARVVGKYRMAKHFLCDITDHSFSYSRNQVRIEREKALDGFYVIRTSVPAHTLGAEQAVGVYKSLSQVERAFRSTVDLKVRPIYHHLATRVRAHVFLCMLAYHVEFHMRKKLAPMLFDDHLRPTPPRPSPVAPATPSPQARRKATTKRSADDLPVHSFRPCSRTLPPSPKTKSSLPPTPSPSTSSPDPLPSSNKHCPCYALPCDSPCPPLCTQYSAPAPLAFFHLSATLSLKPRGKFSLT